jgi:uncharacterized membrane protein
VRATRLRDGTVLVRLHPNDLISAPWSIVDHWSNVYASGEVVERAYPDSTRQRLWVLRDAAQEPIPTHLVGDQLAAATAARTAPAPAAAPAEAHPARADERGPWRLSGGVVVPVLICLLAVIGLWQLPDLSPRDDLPDIGYTTTRALVLETGLKDDAGQDAMRVRVLDGPDAGKVVIAAGQSSLPGTSAGPTMNVGDEVALTRYSGAAGGFSVVNEVWRLPVLLILLGAWALFVTLVGGWQGVRSLLALALTLLVVAKVVVPLLLRGFDPIPLAVGAAAIVTVLTLALTEGLRRTTLAASLGTIVALLITAGIAAVATGAARFSAAQGSEDIIYLFPILGDRLDLGALLLAATILGALGVLDDVTVTQAAAVVALRESDAASPRTTIFRRAMAVGRSHIAATVNTLVLAYLGAGLPLLLLFAIGGDSPSVVANGEIVAVEIVRSLAGSFGIVAAVPLTTAIAAFLLPADRKLLAAGGGVSS